MIPVIRRLAVLLVATLVLTSCASVREPEALAVGDLSISRDGLNELMLALAQVDLEGPDVPATLSADSHRANGRIWLVNAAEVQYLEAIGVEISADESAAARDAVEAGIAGGGLSPIPRSGEAYAALARNQWLASQAELLGTPEAVEWIRDLLSDADVDSRLGVWDREDLVIVPRSLATS